MATAPDSKETVSSDSEMSSGNKTDSGAKSRNGTETGVPKQANADGDVRSSTAINSAGSGSAPATPPGEPPKAPSEGEPSLGKTLATARESRGLSRDDIVTETRIPAHYIEMIERSDYGLISDSLYLMPFLRRYAAFLDLDGEEVAMRFVREVQRAELAAVAAPRTSEPFILRDHKRTRWGRVIMVVVVLVAIVVLYIIASEHHRGELGFHQSSSPAAPVESSVTTPPAVAPLLPLAPAPMATAAPMAAQPPMAASAPMTAPAPVAARVPQAAAPASLPKTSVVGTAKTTATGAAKVPAATRLRKVAPARATSSSSRDE